MLKISVLGCSSIARRAVIPAIVGSGRFFLTHIASRSQDKAKECCRLHNCQACSYEQLLENDDAAVYVSLPVGLHYDWIMRLLQAGKHVLVEKTFVESLENAIKIINFADSKKLVAMEALAYLYHPLHMKVLSLIESCLIGEVRHIEAYFGFPFLPETDIRNKFDLGGGAILDAMIYPLSFALEVMKNRTLVSYCSRIIRDIEQPVDSRGFLQLNWEKVVAHLGYGFGFYYRNTYKIWGGVGLLSAERVFSRPPSYVDDINIINQDGVKSINVEPANQFDKMVHAFADKIEKQDSDLSKMNTEKNILDRLSIISNIRLQYLSNNQNNTDVYVTCE